MDETSSFPFEFPSHPYQITMFDDQLAENQQGYQHMGQFTDAFPEDNTMSGTYLGGTSLNGMPHTHVPQQGPSTMVLPGSHIPFAPARDHSSSLQQELQQHEHQKLVGVPQQDAFMMESPNLSTGSSTTPEACPSGPLITPEDHPQRLGTKPEKSGSNATSPTFQQYTVPPPPPPRKTTQQRQPRQQQQPRQRQRQRPASAAAGIKAPGYSPTPDWQNLPDGDLATKTAMAPEDTAVADVVEELRKRRNRVAANKCRQKKKASAAELEGRNAALQHHNARLNTELGNLKREFAGLQDTLMGHFNCGDVNINTYIQNRATSIATATPATTASAVAATQQPDERRQTRGYGMMELPMFATQGASAMMTPNPNPSPSRMLNYEYDMTPPYPLRSSNSGLTTVGTTTSSSSSSSPPTGEFDSPQKQQQPQQHRQQEQQRTGVFPSAAAAAAVASTGGRTTSRIPHLHHQLSTVSSSSSSSSSVPQNLHGLPSPPSMQLQPSPMITQRQYPFYHSGEVPLQAPFASANAVFGGGHENNGQHHGGGGGGGIQVYQRQQQHHHHQQGYHGSNGGRHSQLEADGSMRCAGEEVGYHGGDADDDNGNGDDAGGGGDNADLGWGDFSRGPGPDFGAGQMNMG